MLIRQAYLCSVLSTKVPWHGKDKGSVLCIRLRTSVEGFSFLLKYPVVVLLTQQTSDPSLGAGLSSGEYKFHNASPQFEQLVATM